MKDTYGNEQLRQKINKYLKEDQEIMEEIKENIKMLNKKKKNKSLEASL